MPRHARPHLHGTFVHVISRFHNKAFLLPDDTSRAIYKDAIDLAQCKWDGRIFSFALMSSHIHFGLYLQEKPMGAMFHSAHTRFANYARKRFGSIGAVFAGRPKQYIVLAEEVPRLIAYHHQNPVVSGIVSSPKDSKWTSHDAYLNLHKRPSWLDVDLGLQTCHFSDTPKDRALFDTFIETLDTKSGNFYRRTKHDPAWHSRNFDDIQISPTGIDLRKEREWERLCANATAHFGLLKQTVFSAHSSPQTKQFRRIVAIVAYEDLLFSLSQIGERMNRSKQSIHKLIHTTRTKGDFNISDLSQIRLRMAQKG